jgi:hypothetical protein
MKRILRSSHADSFSRSCFFLQDLRRRSIVPTVTFFSFHPLLHPTTGKGKRGHGSPRHAGDKRKRDPSPPSEDFGDSEYSEEEVSSESEGSLALASPLTSSDDSNDSQGIAVEVWTYIHSVERARLEESDEEDSFGSSEEWSGDDSDDEGGDGGGDSDDVDGGEGEDDDSKGGEGDNSGNGSGDGKASGKAPLVYIVV